MYRLQLFLGKVYVLLIFLVVEGFAVYAYAHSTVHTRARLLAVSDGLARGIYAGLADAGDYLRLEQTNRALAQRVEELENELAPWREIHTLHERDSIAGASEFARRYTSARVVRGSVDRRENFLMVDRGSLDGVEKGMAVTTLDGCVVGYIEAASGRNAICVSILNTAFRASGVLSSSGHMGSISWPGGDIRTVKLTEVPKYAPVAVGDTVLTSALSFHFPEGLFIGTVERFEMADATASWDIDVRLSADMASLRDVVLVESPEVYDRIRFEEEVLGKIND